MILLVLFADVEHGFTGWDSDAYSPVADVRSWDAMLEVFDMILTKDMASEDEEDMETEAASPDDGPTEVGINVTASRDGVSYPVTFSLL